MKKPTEAGALGVRRGEASWKWFKSAAPCLALINAVLSQAADIRVGSPLARSDRAEGLVAPRPRGRMYGFGTPAQRPVERRSIDHVSLRSGRIRAGRPRRSGSLAFSFDREHSPRACNLDQSVPAAWFSPSARTPPHSDGNVLRPASCAACGVPGRNWVGGTLVSAHRADLRSP
jgi:hypothetical protein